VRPFRLAYIILPLFIVALGLLPSPSDAQTRGPGDRLERELEKTDEILRKAEVIVKEALGPLPKRLLREATDLQREAYSEFQQAPTLSSQQRAVKQSLQARRLALRAIEITKAQRRLLERVRQLIAENRELVTRAREAVEQSASVEAERFLEAGLDQFARGQRAFHNREFRKAVRFTLLGRDLILRAIRVGEGGATLDLGRVRDDLHRTDQFLKEAKSWVDDNRVARVRYAEAERLQEQARRHLRASRLRDARRFTLRARDAALDVLRAGQGDPDREGVESAIDRVAERLRELEPGLREGGAPQVDRLVTQARKHLEKARDALADGALKEALAEAQLAASLLRQAEDRQP